MADYTTWLATKVLNEDAIITYRQLSRALRVHTHLAKQMLFDFHHRQTQRRPGSVHATYLLIGTLQAEQRRPSQTTNLVDSQQDGDEVPMESSPFPSSYPEAEPGASLESEDTEPAEEQIPDTVVILVREEELEETKAEFEDVKSIFVYSLEPGPLKDFQLLTQCNRDVTQQHFWKEDPVQAYPGYGIITNKNSKRRTGKRAPPAAAPAVTATAAKVAPVGAAQESNPAISNKAEESVKPAATSRPATLKKQSSDLFKSFAKSKPPKLKTDDGDVASGPDSAVESPIERKEDEEMQGMSEDEADEAAAQMIEAEHALAAEKRRLRKEKEEKLKKMMDDEDEPMADAGADGVEEELVDDTAALDQPKEKEKTEEATVSDGRRRGRRRVMKKKTYKDEDGYLVTKEEAAWESFSEEEPQVKKPKISAAPALSNKKKQQPAAKGQGNLMNFFRKK